ncbi:MAG TPA: hypothetical protein VF624_18420 [Tepidisphaeraceae bacterium]|jgi:hypothetical protein
MSALKVTQIFLFDRERNRDVVELIDGITVDPALLARCALRPQISGGATGRVLWVIDGTTLCREFAAPFCPDVKLASARLTAGVRTIRAVPYAPPDGIDPRGAIGTSRTLRITVASPVPSPTPSPLPPPQRPPGNVPSDRPRPKSLLLGLCADYVDPQFAGPVVQDLGAAGMRLWCSMRDNQPPPAEKFAYARFYKSLGLKVVMCCTGATLGEWYTPGRVAAWFAEAARLAGGAAGGAVDGWEIGNEPNLRQYNRWEPLRYVRDFVAPASTTLRALGGRIYSPSVTADVGYMRNLIALGLLPLIDVLNVHVYQSSVKAHVELLKRFADLAPDLPLCESEFNINGDLCKPPLTAAQWAEQIGPLVEGVRGVLDEAYLFVLNSHKDLEHSALLNTRVNPIRPNEPMYSAVRQVMQKAAQATAEFTTR